MRIALARALFIDPTILLLGECVKEDSDGLIDRCILVTPVCSTATAP
jgi:ABC-type dipeptide/oligopeptide/nickel transport system ATPase subunit